MTKSSTIRVILLTILLVGLILIGKYTPANQWFEPQIFMDTVKSAGIWSMLIFIILFCISQFFYIPGFILLFLATIIYGPVQAFFLGYVASFIGITINFFAIRWIGGKALSEIKSPIIRSLLNKLDEYPIQVIVILRLIMWMGPILNTVLALSKVKAKDYHIGNLIGIVIPVAVFTFGFYYFKSTLEAIFMN